MTAYLLAFAALALVVVAVGEIGDLSWRRRVADAGRSRSAAPVERARLRR